MGFFNPFRRRKYYINSERPPTPGWLVGLGIFFLLYGASKYYQPATPEAPNPVRENVNKTIETVNPVKLVDQFRDYRRLFFPSAGLLELKDIEPGKGMPAVCGQEVSIAYTTTVIDDRELDDKATADQPRRFNIGEASVPLALEQGVNGMRPGGKRNIISNMGLTYGSEKFARPQDNLPEDAKILYQVELLGVTYALPDVETTPYRIANVADAPGEARIYCGQQARVHVVLWDVGGKKLYDSRANDGKPLLFTPGKSEVFLGLEQGIIGMTRGGSRTMVVPPDFQKTLRGNEPSLKFPFPKAQTVLVDVEAMP